MPDLIHCSRTSWYGVEAYYTGEIDVNATESMISPVNYYDLNFNTIHESFGKTVCQGVYRNFLT